MSRSTFDRPVPEHSWSLEQAIASVSGLCPTAQSTARQRLEQLTMPHWALGRLLDLGVHLSGITGSSAPPVERQAVVVMAADHGVTAEGVSAYPSEVTRQMVLNFLTGGAAINALAGTAGADVLVVDMGMQNPLDAIDHHENYLEARIGPGTANMLRKPAMSRAQARQAVEYGVSLALRLADRYDVVATGEMGIGNTTAASALTAVFCNVAPDLVVGRGTGLDPAGLARKRDVLRKALRKHEPTREDPLGALSLVGGFEIAGLAGLIIGLSARRRPVVLDGFITTAAALVACALQPLCREYLIPAHRSQEPGHAIALQTLSLHPHLDLGLRLGEGTGAALVLPLIRAARAVMTQVATFAEAQVSGKSSSVSDNGVSRRRQAPRDLSSAMAQSA